MADPASPAGSPLQGSVDRIRTAARWLLGAFGAIGVALAVAAQFSNIGKLEGSARDWALVGVGLAFAGIALAIGAGGAVLVPKGRSLNDLAEREREEAEADPARGIMFRDPALKLFRSRPELLSPFASVRELTAERKRHLAEYAKAYKALSRDPSEPKNAKAVEDAKAAGAIVERVSARAHSWADYATIRALFTQAVYLGVLPGVVLAAVGMTIFALKITDVPPAAPTPAEVRIENADLHGLDLHGATLHGADLTGTNLDSANLTGTDLSKVTLDKAHLTGADLTKANLEGASLANAKVERVTWMATTCPDGKVSDDVGGSCASHLSP